MIECNGCIMQPGCGIMDLHKWTGFKCPCSNCIVRINCSHTCKDYRDFWQARADIHKTRNELLRRTERNHVT